MKRFFILLLTISNALFSQDSIPTNITPDTIKAVHSFKKGIKMMNNYQFDNALKYFQLSLEQNKKDVSVIENIGKCYFKLGNSIKSVEYYNKVLTLDSLNLTALNQLGILYSKRANYAKALHQYLKLISIDSTNSYYYKQVAQLAVKLQKFREAEMFFSKAYNLNSKDVAVINELSNLYFKKLNNTLKADSIIKIGLCFDSTNLKLLQTKAKIDYTSNNYESAIKYIDKILVQSSDTSASLFKMLGVSYYYLEDFDKSIKIFERLTELKKGTEAIYYFLGLAYKKKNNLEKSLYYFNLAIKEGISNSLPTYYTNIALCYEADKNYEESIKAYKIAYKISKNKILLFHLARNYDEYYSDKKTALSYYSKYLLANDTVNIDLTEYSKYRISLLQETIHFSSDTL